MTQPGVILGTAAYMSPEQAPGKSVDKRTDIWAFGCVVYEMLTARVAFAGATVHDTLAAVLSREPEWSRLSAHTPAAIRRLLRRCLQQDSKQRLHDIADARIELREALTSPGETHTAGARRSPSARLLMASCFAALTAVLGVVAAWNLKPFESPAITRVLSQRLPELTSS
jgi:eukaryotic-like serine/threonine-protein kinase